MTRLLEQAFAAAARLPQEEQDALAAALLADLVSEAHVDEAIGSRPDALERLAEEALGEHRAGRTELLDPDAL